MRNIGAVYHELKRGCKMGTIYKKSVLEKLEEKKDEAKATIGTKKTSYRDAVSL